MQLLRRHVAKLGAALLVSMAMGGWVTATAGPAAGSPAGQGPGASAAALACRHGGWMTLEGTDGTLFTTAGGCVIYATAGGVLVPKPSIAVSFSPSSGSVFCEVHLTMQHFQATTHYAVNYTIEETGGGTVFGPLSYAPGVTTDSSGAFSGTVFSLLNATNAISFTIGGVTTPFVPITC